LKKSREEEREPRKKIGKARDGKNALPKSDKSSYSEGKGSEKKNHLQ